MTVEHEHSSVVQQDEYYPYGQTFNSYQREKSVANLYQYNGKEKQDELDLAWLDYGARNYIPEIGRWGTIDVKADKYNQHSPYNYVLNNPLIFKDPDGKEIYFVTTSGAVLAATQENLKNTQIASAYKGITSTESGKETWDKYSKNGEKDIYIGLSDAGSTSTTINGLSGYDLDKSGDGVVDKVLAPGYEVFRGVDISNSKGKNIALISLKKSKFKDDPNAIDDR